VCLSVTNRLRILVASLRAPRRLTFRTTRRRPLLLVRRPRPINDEDFADLLHRFCAGFLAYRRDELGAAPAVFAQNPDLDELVAPQIRFDLARDLCGEACVPNYDHRAQVMRPGFQVPAFSRSKAVHGRDFTVYFVGPGGSGIALAHKNPAIQRLTSPSARLGS